LPDTPMFAACGSSYRSHRPCWSEACPRCRRRGLPATPCNRPSRTSSLLPPVGAVLARDKGDAVYQTYRVIVHREQARSYRRAPKPVGARLARDAVDAVRLPYRVIVPREQVRSYPLWERGLPAMQSTRSSYYPLSKCRLKATRSANFQKSAQLKRLIISKYPVTLRN